MAGLVLSLFPGIGLLDMAFEEQGFCVVRGPDLLWGGDIKRFHPPAGKFEGVIGGTPCQAFSSMVYLVVARGLTPKENLIPEFERCVNEAAPVWFVMENVARAPLPTVSGYHVHDQLLRDVWVGGETLRKRRFSFGSRNGMKLAVETLALHRPDPEPSALASGGARLRPIAIGGSGKRKDRGRLSARGYKTASDLLTHCRLQGLPEQFLSDAPFTVAGKIAAIGNGVPLPMGRAVAKAVAKALEAG